MSGRRRFGLDRLMTRAKVREDDATRQVADRRREQESVEADYLVQLDRFRAMKEATQHAERADEFRRAQDYAALQARALLEAEAERERAEAAVREAHEALLAAAREKRTFERLDERDRVALAITATRAAQRSLDDLASRRRRL